jgi:hypothetical protein
VADITFIPTWSGFLYLAMVLDVYSRRVVGWAMETHLRTELILAALEMALVQRRPKGVIHHSDPGCQYTSYAFGKRCQEAGVMPSIGSVGDAYDNAMAESFFATLERELLSRRRFRSAAEAKMAVFEWLEGWYNPHRRHSSIGYRSPVNYERAHGHARSPRKNPAIGIGGVVTHAPLPHHRTCGSRIRRFGGLSRASWKGGKDPASQNAHWEGRPGEPWSVREARGRANWKPFSRTLPS